MNNEQASARPLVVVIGGGVTGLAAAHRLSELGGENPTFAVLLLEASERLGGTIRTHRRDGFLLEGGPDSFLSEKPEVIELASRVGLTPRLIGTNERHRRSFVARGRRLHPTPEGFNLLAPSRLWPLVTSGIFSARGKARMALDLVLPRGRNPDADESLASFVRRRFGREALERVAQPMAGGIYTADPNCFRCAPRCRASSKWSARTAASSSPSGAPRAAAARTELLRRAKKRAARATASSFLDEGMQVLTDSLGRAPAARRSPFGHESGGAGSRRRARRAAGSSGPPAEKRFARPRFASRCARTRRRGCCAASRRGAGLGAGREPLRFDSDGQPRFRLEDVSHPLDGFGFVVPHAEGRTVIACSFSSVKFAGARARRPRAAAGLRRRLAAT
jgi:oxygen-dependent protoporphyrinogen oxidase